MTIMDLTETFDVRRLSENDIPSVLALMKGNLSYFETCPPLPDENTVRTDLSALPPGIAADHKFYLGIFQENQLICAADLILGYPAPEIVWIGFFMMAQTKQRQGIGSALVQKILNVFAEIGIDQFQLGCMEGNYTAECFWRKNGFEFTGESRSNTHGTVRIMKRTAGDRL